MDICQAIRAIYFSLFSQQYLKDNSKDFTFDLSHNIEYIEGPPTPQFTYPKIHIQPPKPQKFEN